MTVSVASFGQLRTPVFATEQDSTAFENLNRRLQDAFRNPRNTVRIDSIARAMAIMRERAVRYRTSYSPSLPAYTRRPTDPKEITKLSIANFKGKGLPDSIYLMTNIAELELVNTAIQKLPARLAQLPSLKKISLLNNRPRRRLRIGKNPVLETLVIHDDEIDRRPRNFRRLPNLSVLDLGRNAMTAFPKVKGNAKLSRLVLADNRLTLTDVKADLPSLRALVLTSNGIQHVPPTIAHFPNLTSLDLMVNKVETLPPELGNLSNLEHLLLYKNNLTRLHPAIYRLKNLKVIDLYYNQLDQLDTAIRHWKKLEILYLSNNRLFSLPGNLGELSMLRELYIHHNQLSGIPESISSLDSLRVLRANENRFQEFPSAILGLPLLENLDVASNQLTAIPAGVFDFPRMKILSLKENPLGENERKLLRTQARKLMEEREVIIHLEGLIEPPGEN